MGSFLERRAPLAELPGAWRRLSSRDLTSAPDAARRLLGCLLVRRTPRGWIGGRIVETEAYLADEDPASHSHRGPTRRNASMFARAGTVYVYRIYGLHLCANVVTGRLGVGEAVLLRALEPMFGLDAMERARGTDRRLDLCSGPAKLVQALGIAARHDGSCWCTGGELKLLEPSTGTRLGRHEFDVGRRIGIRRGAELALRYRAR